MGMLRKINGFCSQTQIDLLFESIKLSEAIKQHDQSRV